MSKILHQQDFRRTKFTPKKCVNFVKFKLRQYDVFNQTYFKSTVFNIRLYIVTIQDQSFFPLNFFQKKRKILTKKPISNKKAYAQSNKFMPVQRILHQHCWWCWRHLEGLQVGPVTFSQTPPTDRPTEQRSKDQTSRAALRR